MLEALAHDAGLALRNLRRQGRRTAMTVFAIAFGVSALVFAGGFIEFIYQAMREGTIRSRIGHLQVAKAGYFASGGADPRSYLLPSKAEVRKSLLALDGVASVAARLEFSGIVSLGDAAFTFVGEGIEPENELELSEAVVISEGRELAAGDVQGVLLGNGLAASLGARLDDKVVLLANTPSGGINAIELTVRGFFSTATKAFDDYALRTTLPAAQALMRVDGVHLLVVALHDTEMTESAKRMVQERLAGTPTEVIAWNEHEVADFYRKTVSLFSRQVGVLQFIVLVLMLLVVANSITMNVLERTREIGTALAIGMPRRRLFRQFALEGVMLGAIGAGIGLAAGSGIAVLASWIGIPMPPPPGLGRGFTAEVKLTWRILTDGAAIALLGALVASIVATTRVLRLNIVDALRHAA